MQSFPAKNAATSPKPGSVLRRCPPRWLARRGGFSGDRPTEDVFVSSRLQLAIAAVSALAVFALILATIAEAFH